MKRIILKDSTLKKTRRIGLLGLLLITRLMCHSPLIMAGEKDAPMNWPWRGVVLNSGNGLPKDISILIDRLGINSVRLSLNVRSMAKYQGLNPEKAWRKNLQWADSMLDACKKNGVVGIISLHEIPIDPNLGLTQESAGFWNNPEQLAEAVRLAGSLASHFKDRGWELGAYELLSEPVLREGESVINPPQWPQLIQMIIKEIRNHDSQRWIVTTPGLGGLPQIYKDFKPLQFEKIVYGAHMYVPHAFTHQGIQGRKMGFTYPGMIFPTYWDKKALINSLKDLRSFQEKYGVFVWIGEFGAVRWADGGEQYLLDLASIFDQYGWGWCYFAYKEYHGWNPDYDTNFSTDDPKDWKWHNVGKKSTRWTTLKKMFGGEKPK